MSDVFALDAAGQDRVDELARANPFNPADVKPGFLSNLPAAVGEGILRGGARAARAAGIGLVGLTSRIAPYMNPDDPDFMNPGAYAEQGDRLFKAVDDTAGSAVDYWTPDAHTTGAAGRVLGGFGEMVLPLMATAGSPSALMGTQAIDTAADLTRAGVDAKTAVAAGTAQAAATGLGFKVPFLGSTLASRMASGAVGNTLVNAGTTAATAELLRQRGYEDLAKNYNPLDFEARTVDVLTGLLFGGIHHAFAPDAPAVNPRLPDAVADAVLTARNARNFQETTAPGTVPDVASSVAHQDALSAALDQLSRGEPVNVGDAVAAHEGAAFLPDGQPQRIQSAARELAKESAAPADDVTVELSPDQALEAPVVDALPTEKPTTPEPQPQGEPIAPDAPRVEAATPELQGLRDLAAQNPDAVIHSGHDEDGNPVKTTVAAEAQRIEDEHAQAVTDSKAYEAAVQCFLGNGA